MALDQTPSARDNDTSLADDLRLADLGSGAGPARWYWASTIDENLWSKGFPYQLLVVRASGDRGKPYKLHRRFVLPINPEALSNATPFAINVQATQGGVNEQHGGVPFRQIAFSGSFGVMVERESAGALRNEPLFGLASGTFQALQNVGSSAEALGSGGYKQNLISEKPDPSRTTGYYQFRMLQMFLESYAEMKKRREGRDYRLALVIWKEEAAYLVTPQLFQVQRTAQSPHEYRYTLQLQAWRRVHPNDIATDSNPAAAAINTYKRGTSLYKSARNKLENARKLMANLKKTVLAVRADFEQVVGGTLRQVSAFVNATGGFVKAAHDFPSSMRQSWETAVVQGWDQVKGSFNNLDPTVKAQVDRVTAEVEAFRAGTRSDTPTLARLLADDDAQDFNSLINPDTLNLTDAQRQAMADLVDEALLLTSADFASARNTVLAFAADYSDRVGLGNATYDKVLRRTSSGVTVKRAPSEDDLRVLHALAASAEVCASLVKDAPSRHPQSAVEYVAGVASRNGINMRVPLSKFAVPFPYGGSLEKLAQQYLGDASRWLEIAQLNDLRAPYVDEAGAEHALVTNGNGNQVNVADAEGLVVGQQVTLFSSVEVEDKRRALDVQKVGGYWTITLDGEADLAKFKTGDTAKARWHLFGTVNSQRVIYIPSDREASEDILKYVPNADDFDRILKVGTVDGMLTETGDIVVTPDGDWPYVYGLASMVQWARIALNTPVGSLTLHPTFGVEAEVGQSIAGMDVKSVLESLKGTFGFNPAFSGLQSAFLNQDGPALVMTLELGVQGSDALLPLSFTVSQ